MPWTFDRRFRKRWSFLGDRQKKEDDEEEADEMKQSNVLITFIWRFQKLVPKNINKTEATTSFHLHTFTRFDVM